MFTGTTFTLGFTSTHNIGMMCINILHPKSFIYFEIAIKRLIHRDANTIIFALARLAIKSNFTLAMRSKYGKF